MGRPGVYGRPRSRITEQGFGPRHPADADGTVREGPVQDVDQAGELLVAEAHLLGGQATVTARAQDAVGLLAERPAAACLIVLGRARDVDVTVLHTALTAGVACVGDLGSRRAEALARVGLDDEQIARVHGLIGPDSGARTSAGTALAALDGRAARVLGEGTGPIDACPGLPRVRRSPGTPRST
ncbi:XdhC family protein [Streptomyces graminifolii]|uniref:XdhC family protein n=1 Tax=Streptomyces graminifolii TaxID=1266771 RepID=UPI004058513F